MTAVRSSRPASPPQATVRAARAQDRAPVQRIATRSMREFGVAPDFDHLNRELGNFGAPGPAILAQLVVESDGRIAGSLILSWKDADTLKLSAFYVDAGVRGEGRGRALLDAALALARGSSAVRIYLETCANMAAAIHLYTMFGWRRGERLAPDSGADWSYLLDLTTPSAQAQVLETGS